MRLNVSKLPVIHLELFQSAWCWKAIEVRQRFLLETAFIIQEKRFRVAKTYRAGENMNVLCLQAFGLAHKMGRPRSSTRSSIAVAR